MASVLKGSGSGAGIIVHPASIQGGWVVANSDLETADSAANLLKPHLVSRAAVVWIEVPHSATKVLVRGRNLATLSGITTATAVVRIWGANGSPTRTNASTSTSVVWGTSPTATNGGEFTRIDGSGDSGATGASLTFALTGNLEDATYEYTDIPYPDGYDMLGCSWVTVLVETACVLDDVASPEALLKFF